MDDFNPATWFDLLKHNPIAQVMLGGLLAGSGITQAVKKTWLAFGDASKISVARYRASCMWLAMLSTTMITYGLFHAIIFVDPHGLAKAVALVTGLPAPLAYNAVRAFARWKFPAFAAAMSDNGAAFKTAPAVAPPS